MSQGMHVENKISFQPITAELKWQKHMGFFYYYICLCQSLTIFHNSFKRQPLENQYHQHRKAMLSPSPPALSVPWAHCARSSLLRWLGPAWVSGIIMFSGCPATCESQSMCSQMNIACFAITALCSLVTITHLFLISFSPSVKQLSSKRPELWLCF